MKHPVSEFDVTKCVEAITDALRARLPLIVAGEVSRQLKQHLPGLHDLEAVAQRSLNAQKSRGLLDDSPAKGRTP